MKRVLLLLLVLIFNVSVLGFASTTDHSQLNKNVKAIVYKNSRYGFSFKLPESWENYRLVSSKWKGYDVGGTTGEKIVQRGPMISIRHPEWTEKKQRQDIPIMIFTHAQWNLLQKDKFHIGAAPIGPSELGRNNKYVFALPARYNFAFPEGYKEVENILNNKSLHTFDVK